MAGRIRFGFAFNNSHFSDRLLVFEVSDSPALIRPHCKESVAMENEEDGPGERICHVKMNSQDSDLQNEEDGEMTDDCGDKLHVEPEMDEDSGHRRFQGAKEGKLAEEDRRLMQLHVNSVILASHSEYFMSLFCNGMSESSSEIVVVQVTEEERQGLIKLIEYMYTGELKLNMATAGTTKKNLKENLASTTTTKKNLKENLASTTTTKKKNLKENLASTTTTKKKKMKNLKENLKEDHAGRSCTEEALRLLGLADRFAISSCMEQLLKELDPSSNLHDCLLVLGLPETLKSNPALSSVVSSACHHLRNLFVDISPASKLRSELLSLPIEAFKVVLGSDLLHVQHEEEVFACLSDWLEFNFSSSSSGYGNGGSDDDDDDDDDDDAGSEDRTSSAMAMVASELSEMVRFPWLTGDFLDDVVSSSSFMRSDPCRALIMEALRFRSFTPARQHRLMAETSSHHRFRPRNAFILDSFWGSCRSYVLLRTASSCHAHFEFPLEMVVCMGESFRSRTLTLGGESFLLQASPMSIRAPYLAARVSCRIELIRISNGRGTMLMMNPCNGGGGGGDDDDGDDDAAGDGDEGTSPPPTWLHYTISAKRSFTQEWDSTRSGCCDLLLPPDRDGDDDDYGPCARFDDLFPGWFVERGFSYPRWNASNSGTVFFKLDLRLCCKPYGV